MNKYVSAVGLTKSYKKLSKYLAWNFGVRRTRTQEEKDMIELQMDLSKRIDQNKVSKRANISSQTFKHKVIQPMYKNKRVYGNRPIA